MSIGRRIRRATPVLATLEGGRDGVSCHGVALPDRARSAWPASRVGKEIM